MNDDATTIPGDSVSRQLREKFARMEPDASAAPEPESFSVAAAPSIAPIGYYAGHATYADYRASPWWARVREDALHRAHNRCQLCAAQLRLEVHHNTYDRLGREWPSDVIVLCRICHAKHHDKLPEGA